MKHLLYLSLLLSHVSWLVSSFVATPRPFSTTSVYTPKRSNYDVSLNMEIDGSVAIVGAAVLVFFGQKINKENTKGLEGATTTSSATDAIAPTVVPDFASSVEESSVDRSISIQDVLATGGTESDGVIEDGDVDEEEEEKDTDDESDIKEEVEDAIESTTELIPEVTSDPEPVKTISRASIATPDIDSAKRAVASTLQGELARKEKLTSSTRSLEFDVTMIDSGPLVEDAVAADVEASSGGSEAKKSAVGVRILKKIAMPWKKFSNLS